MYSQALIITLFAALATARFGQEQERGVIEAISALEDLGAPGQAAILAGDSINYLRAAANPCGKLMHGDRIIAKLGNNERAIVAARTMVAAEQNFNPFVASVPVICADPSLPKTEALRGVIPLVDPAVVGHEIENTKSALSLKTPFKADGLSVAQVMVSQGFSNFSAVLANGKEIVAADVTPEGCGDVSDFATSDIKTSSVANLHSSNAQNEEKATTDTTEALDSILVKFMRLLMVEFKRPNNLMRVQTNQAKQ